MVLKQLDIYMQKKGRKRGRVGETEGGTERERKKDLNTDLSPFTKINSKWIIDLKVKCEIIKFLQDNIEKNLDDFGYSDDLLDTTSKAKPMKEIIDKLDFIKIKDFCSVKDSIKRTRERLPWWCSG